MLWKIDDSETYLLGSLHVTNMSKFKFRPHVEEAFSQAQTIVFECDFDIGGDFSLRCLPDGKTLNSIVSPELFAKAASWWSRLKIHAVDMSALLPFYVSTELSMARGRESGYCAEFGIDRYVKARAKAEGKAIDTLETANDGLNAIAKIPLPEQIQMLAETLEMHDLSLHILAKLVKAWSRDDIAWLEKYCGDRQQALPEFWRLLVVERNAKWLPAIATLAEKPPACLIVVGVFHMFGPLGILELLKERGHVLTPMSKNLRPTRKLH